MKIYLAPLEGVTGYIYRNNYEKFYGKGQVDKYFAPFISPSDKVAIIPKERKDLLPENNQGINLIPQILTCKSNQFNASLDELCDMGYTEVNLNLGCPSGTVCAKGKGAGFLPETIKLKSFLEDIYSYADSKNVAISLKTRLGYYHPDEFYDLIEIFNEFPVSELIVHPRIRDDYYKGEPRYEYYKYALDNSKSPLVYNGNIFSQKDYLALNDRYNQNIDTIMVGRGLIANPSLISELLTGDKAIDYKLFWEFHDSVYRDYQAVMSPDINVLYKMKELWGFWKVLFDDSNKEMKLITKAKKYIDYDVAIQKLKSKY